MIRYSIALATLLIVSLLTNAQSVTTKTVNGLLEGQTENGVLVFKGVPYAQPPVGPLRWKEPQPLKPWPGTRKATAFASRAMQQFIYKDMQFRSPGVSEDCLYLNVWTPSTNRKDGLPVLVYFHGGGLSAGDGSENRYDGASMAGKGVVTVTVNYRLGIFGFFVHPELTAASVYHSSGNYGLLDQRAALQWVQNNIAAFGGDPAKVTIAGQSAGSLSVSAHMASPISKGLFRAAIGESGALPASSLAGSLAEAEKKSQQFMTQSGYATLQALRKLSAGQLLELATKEGMPRFGAIVDGYFLPKSPMDIFATGLQADVPLLAGWTSAEVTYHSLLGRETPTIELYKSTLQKLYPGKADEMLRLYPANTAEEMLQSATDLASDRFIAYSTWKWMDLHAKTSGSTVYRYLFARKLPAANDSTVIGKEPLLGAPHSADIDYALGNLRLNKVYQWTPVDDTISTTIQNFLANFIKTGNPNGLGLPDWPGLQSSIPKVMVFGDTTKALPEKNLRRYVFLDQFYYK